MRRTWWWAAPVFAAAVVGPGCGGSLAGSDAGSQADASITTEYRWGDVSVHVQPTGALTGSLTLVVSDHGNPATLSTTMTFPASTTGSISDGALVVSQHGCSGDPSLHRVEIHSCGQAGGIEPSVPGCMAVRFDKQPTVLGNFTHPTGARCDVQSAWADIMLPQGSWKTGQPTEAASGMFLLECVGSDGTNVQLQGTFVLPQSVTILAC